MSSVTISPEKNSQTRLHVLLCNNETTISHVKNTLTAIVIRVAVVGTFDEGSQFVIGSE